MTQETNPGMTQADYKLWTGLNASTYTSEEWGRLVKVAALRLASFLCLEQLPTDSDGTFYDDIQQLLANFMAGVFAHEGNPQTVESKHVRNFTINFKTEAAADAFAQIAQQYADIIAHYSNCDLGIKVEGDAYYACNGCGACKR